MKGITTDQLNLDNESSIKDFLKEVNEGEMITSRNPIPKDIAEFAIKMQDYYKEKGFHISQRRAIQILMFLGKKAMEKETTK